ncbi:hypothetical protein J6590_093463 [Homalodisca vitripennis]|nr:hypothetical protein J6590_093463 [Homalodisca vitripennis]
MQAHVFRPFDRHNDTQRVHTSYSIFSSPQHVSNPKLVTGAGGLYFQWGVNCEASCTRSSHESGSCMREVSFSPSEPAILLLLRGSLVLSKNVARKKLGVKEEGRLFYDS